MHHPTEHFKNLGPCYKPLWCLPPEGICAEPSQKTTNLKACSQSYLRHVPKFRIFMSSCECSATDLSFFCLFVGTMVSLDMYVIVWLGSVCVICSSNLCHLALHTYILSPHMCTKWYCSIDTIGTMSGHFHIPLVDTPCSSLHAECYNFER